MNAISAIWHENKKHFRLTAISASYYFLGSTKEMKLESVSKLRSSQQLHRKKKRKIPILSGINFPGVKMVPENEWPVIYFTASIFLSPAEPSLPVWTDFLHPPVCSRRINCFPPPLDCPKFKTPVVISRKATSIFGLSLFQLWMPDKETELESFMLAVFILSM